MTEFNNDYVYIALYCTPEGRWIVSDHDNLDAAQNEVAAIKRVVPDYKATIVRMIV